LKGEAIDRTLRRTYFRRGCGSVVRQTTHYYYYYYYYYYYIVALLKLHYFVFKNDKLLNEWVYLQRKFAIFYHYEYIILVLNTSQCKHLNGKAKNARKIESLLRDCCKRVLFIARYRNWQPINSVRLALSYSGFTHRNCTQTADRERE